MKTHVATRTSAHVHLHVAEAATKDINRASSRATDPVPFPPAAEVQERASQSGKIDTDRPLDAGTAMATSQQSVIGQVDVTGAGIRGIDRLTGTEMINAVAKTTQLTVSEIIENQEGKLRGRSIVNTTLILIGIIGTRVIHRGALTDVPTPTHRPLIVMGGATIGSGVHIRVAERLGTMTWPRTRTSRSVT